MACAHVRMGKRFDGEQVRTTLSQFVEIWRFLKKMEKKKFNIFIATDSVNVAKRARKLFSTSLVEIAGNITYMDVTVKEDICDGFRKSLLDFLVLTKCDVLVLTRSGFGILAANLRNDQSELHCMTPTGLVGCTRLTVHGLYPTLLLSPA